MWRTALGAMVVLGLAAAAGIGWVSCSTVLSEEPESARMPSPVQERESPPTKPVVVDEPTSIEQPGRAMPAGTPAHGILMATYYMDTWGKTTIDLDARTIHVESRWMGYEPQNETKKLGEEDVVRIEGLIQNNWGAAQPPDPSVFDVHETMSVSEGGQSFLRDTTMIEQDATPTGALRAEIGSLGKRFVLKHEP